MVRTPFYPSETSRAFAERTTEEIAQDRFQTGLGGSSQTLLDIDGVGKDLMMKLKREGFHTPEDIQRASTSRLTAVEGVGPAKAENLQDAAATVTRPDFEELTDLDGVGPSTANRLRDAGITEPYELRGKTQREIASIEGIGPKRAARIRADVEFEAPASATKTGFDPETESGATVLRKSRAVSMAPFGETLKTPAEDDDGVSPAPPNVGVEGGGRQEAIEHHAERSEEARQSDESFNAPIMLDEETWSQNMNEYDYPGVDTIPRSRKLERAREKLAVAREVDAVRSAESGFGATDKGNAMGTYKAGGITVDTSFRQSEDTLAHEVGHAIDRKFDRPSGVDARGNERGDGIFDDPEVLEQAQELSRQRRGSELDTDYLESQNEIFADLFADATINPRRTKREAPAAFKALEDAVGFELGGF